MNTKQKTTIMLLTAAITASAVFAAEKSEDKTYVDPAKAASGTEFKQAPPLAMPKEVNEFKWGGDFRFRTVYFDNIPYANDFPGVGKEARGGANSFQRYRTRIFGEYHPNEDLYFRGRLVNEWRTSQNGSAADGWDAFDETVIDNLFVDYKHDMFDVRLGRQDLIYGTGKLILDGTPKDGSRTIYFDAAKVAYKGIDNTTVDFLAMYTHAKDPLALHSQDRDIVGYAGPANPYEGVEAGGAVYIKNKTYEDLPWEAYWIIKTDQQLPTDEVNTVGTRLMPKWADGTFDGNLEMAYQSTTGTDAFMVDALVNWNIMEDQKGKLGLGWYHLSEDWNPVFARWPQYSELYVYSYDTTGAGQWKNVSMPHIDFSISPMKNYKADFLLGYMFAPENDGLGSGHNRGLLFTWWNRFTIKEQLFSQRDKLSGHILFEMMQPGAYYDADQRDHIATFLRFELNYAF
ncbi:MAG: hypothetical protein DRP64_09720 [Verrucomicrobia bacterium]|nr:MAG: hypothetical protein DRP64_09720 [Verrucomicrobiota bacterium]